MKNLFILLYALLLFCSTTYAQTDSDSDHDHRHDTLDAYNAAYKQSAADSPRNGYSLPVIGKVKVLLVWAEKVNSFTVASPFTGYGEGVLPTDHNDYFDSEYSTGVEPASYLSKYFYQQSLGQYIVLGDHLDHVIQVNSSVCTGNAYSIVYNYLNQLYGVGNFENRLVNQSNIADFDDYTINYTTNNMYINTIMKEKLPTNPNNRFDAVIILWKNNPCLQGWGYGLGPSGNANNNSLSMGNIIGVENDAAFDASISKDFITQEFFHAMYGHNWWHTGTGAGYQTFLAKTNAWGIPMQVSGAGISNSANGWDRDHLGWYGWLDKIMTIRKSYTISALDLTGNEIETDFNVQSNIGNGLFVLRDLVKYGDAIRIKLPHLQDDPNYPLAKNQYLWIENRQRQTDFDKGVYENFSCKEATLPGMWAYIQAGKDDKVNGLTTNNAASANGLASWLMPLSAEGNYDFKYLNPHTAPNVNCVWGNSVVLIDKNSSETKPNPFTGFSDLFNCYNADGSNKLYDSGDKISSGKLKYSPGLAEYVNGSIEYNLNRTGDSEDSYNFAKSKSKISLSTNPSSTPVYTYKSEENFDNTAPSNQHNQTYENRSIWLNGISVELIQENYEPSTFGDGAILVKVKLDEYNVENDVRWCGNIKLNPHDFDSSPADHTDNKYSLNLKTGKTILLDRGKSYTRQHAVDTDPINGEYRFTEPTVFTCLTNSFTHLESNSKIIVDNNSSFIINQNARVELESGSEIVVRNGGKLILNNGSDLVVKDGAKITIESTGSIEYNSGGVVKLNGTSAVLDIAGTLHIGDGASFGFDYDGTNHGYLKLSSPLGVSNNITAGTNSAIAISGYSKNNKVLEINQETMYGPSNLASFVISDGKVEMKAGARLQPSSNSISFANMTLTSTSGAYNAHRGLTIYGQPNVYIDNCTFKYGKYGIYAWLTYGGAALTINNSTFQECNQGIFSHDKGIKLNNVNFIKNTQNGWYAEMMSFPSVVNGGVFGNANNSSNGTAISYNGFGTATLKLNDTKIKLNTIGVEASGTTVFASCGEISYNSSYGFYMKQNATLDIGDNVSALGSQVTAVNNGTTIRLLNAYNVDAMNGYNNLYPLTGGTKSAVYGTLNRGCQPFSINESHNKWKANGGNLTKPEYMVTTRTVSDEIVCQAKPVTLIDNTPVDNPSQCGQANECNPPSACKKEDPLDNCPGCISITTKDFVLEKLNNAIRNAITHMTLAGGNDDKVALDKLHQIIKFPITNPKPEETYLLELAYRRMITAIGNAFYTGQIARSLGGPGTSEEVQMVLEVQNKKINEAIAKNDYLERVYLSMERAQVHRLNEDRASAINQYDEILAFAKPEERVMVEDWKCKTQIEQMVFDGSLELSDVESYTNSNPCAGGNSNRMAKPKGRTLKNSNANSSSIGTTDSRGYSSNNSTTIEEEAITYVNDYKIYPVPSKDFTKFDINVKESGNVSITILDISGKVVTTLAENKQTELGVSTFVIDNSRLENGVYYIECKTENEKYVGKFVVIK